MADEFKEIDEVLKRILAEGAGAGRGMDDIDEADVERVAAMVARLPMRDLILLAKAIGRFGRKIKGLAED